MIVTLRLKKSTDIPIEADAVDPGNFEGKSKDEICGTEIWHGNQQERLDSLFDVDLADGETKVIFESDCSKVKRIGERLRKGEIEVRGDVGMHCGALMEAGSIRVKGSAGAWSGAEMKGGELVIEGNAAEHVGSAYIGATTGMNGGRIEVGGDVGDYLGEYMSGGEIHVKGKAGTLAGLRMKDGAIRVGGDATMPGGEMTGGTIFVGEVSGMLPSFIYKGKENGYEKYIGDLAMKGKGKGTLFIKH